jgi:hypothetical protein
MKFLIIQSSTSSCATFSVLGPNIHFSTLLWNTFNLCYTVSHPYKIRDKIIVNPEVFGEETRRQKTPN